MELIKIEPHDEGCRWTERMRTSESIEVKQVYEVRPRNAALTLFRYVAYRSGVFCEPDAQFGKFIHEPRLVGIAHRGFAVWQNPFGMLCSEVVMNLLPEIRNCFGLKHNHSALLPLF